MSEQNEKNQIEELEAPEHVMTPEETEQVKGGLSAGKVSYSDLSFAPGGSNSAHGAGGGGGAGKVSMQDFH